MNAGGVLNTCKLSGKAPSGYTSSERVSNAWVIYLEVEDSLGKPGVILHTSFPTQVGIQKGGDLRTCRL